MSTLNITYQTPKHKYDFEIEIDDSVTKTITCSPIELNPFVYGNDEDIDTIIYPGSVSIEFSILYKVESTPPNPFGGDFNYDSGASESEYYRLNSALAFNDTVVTINKDDVEFLKGYVDPQGIGGSYERKSFELTILSDLGKLKDLDPRDLDPADYLSPPYDVSPGQQVLFTDLLLTLIQEVYPSINQVVLMSDVKSETVYTLLGVPQSVGAQYFGTFNYDYIGAASRYDNAADIVKDVLAIFGAVGIVIDNKFIMQSRFYYSQTTVTILKRQFVKDKGPTPYSSQKLEGLYVLVMPGGTSLTYEAIYGTVETDGSYNVINSDEVETIKLIAVGGDPPGVDGTVYPLLVRNIWLYIPAFITGLGYDTWGTSVRNSFYVTGGTQKPLWQCVADEMWDLVSQNRIVYAAEVDGVDWEYNKYYDFDAVDSPKLRPRKLYYDDTTDTTKLELIQG